MDFEEILTTINNNSFGIYQKRYLFFVLIPFSFMIPWAITSTVFMVATPRHACKVTELQNLPFDLQMMLTSPKTIDHPHNSCSMIDVNYSKLLIELNINSSKLDDLNEIKERIKNYYNKNKPNFKKCENYLFDNKDYKETAVTAFNLVCEKKKLSDDVLSISGLGSIIGTPLFGWMSDKIGRKKTLFIVVIIFIIGSLSPSISYLKTYYAFMVSRFLISSTTNVLYQAPFILIIELVCPDKRTMLGFISGLIYAIGVLIVPGYAYLFGNWVYLNHIIVLTGLIYLILTYYLLESPRWLLSSSRIEEAEKVLKKIAIINKIPNAKDRNFVQKLELVNRKLSCLSKISSPALSPVLSPESKSDSLLSLLFRNSKIRKIFFIITLGYTANAVAYNAINLNTFSLSGNVFFNYFLMSVIELPASFLGFYAMESRLGRRLSGSLFLLIFAFFNLFASLIHDYKFVITLSVISKLLTSISFGGIYQGLSLSLGICNINAIILPYLIDRNQFGDNFLVMAIITIICLIASISFSFIPETLGEVLPQTVEDAVLFGEDQKYFSLAKKKKVSNDKKEKNDEENRIDNIDDKKLNCYNNDALSVDDIKLNKN